MRPQPYRELLRRLFTQAMEEFVVHRLRPPSPVPAQGLHCAMEDRADVRLGETQQPGDLTIIELCAVLERDQLLLASREELGQSAQPLEVGSALGIFLGRALGAHLRYPVERDLRPPRAEEVHREIARDRE